MERAVVKSILYQLHASAGEHCLEDDDDSIIFFDITVVTQYCRQGHRTVSIVD